MMSTCGLHVFTRALDLPVGKLSNLLRYYTLTLSSDGSTLYAANGALGVVSTISLDSNVIFNDQVNGTVHFNPNVNVNQDDRTRLLHNGAALSTDNNKLYFVGMQGIMTINIGAGGVAIEVLDAQMHLLVSTNGQAGILDGTGVDDLGNSPVPWDGQAVREVVQQERAASGHPIVVSTYSTITYQGQHVRVYTLINADCGLNVHIVQTAHSEQDIEQSLPQ